MLIPLAPAGIAMRFLRLLLIVSILVLPERASADDRTLVSALAKQLKCTEQSAEAQLKLVFDAIALELAAGRAVSIGGFGRFFVYEKAGSPASAATASGGSDPSAGRSTGANRKRRKSPSAAEPILPAKRFARFRASELLKTRINLNNVNRTTGG